MERILPVSLSNFPLIQTLPPSPILEYNEAKWYFISPSKNASSKSPVVLVTAPATELRCLSLSADACFSLICLSSSDGLAICEVLSESSRLRSVPLVVGGCGSTVSLRGVCISCISLYALSGEIFPEFKSVHIWPKVVGSCSAASNTFSALARVAWLIFFPYKLTYFATCARVWFSLEFLKVALLLLLSLLPSANFAEGLPDNFLFFDSVFISGSTAFLI